VSTLQTSRATGARDGAAYLESLRDGREVWVQGERVSDVPGHPVFRGVAASMARLYDLQSAPGTCEVMTYALPDGRRASCSYLAPRTPDELAQRRANTEAWARESFGLLGRPPDFCAASWSA
jgi:aromatic ring hydroxylase